jgi:hypothetical protein
MPTPRRLRAAALLAATVASAAYGQSPRDQRGNNTVPILTAIYAGPRCHDALDAAPALPQAEPFAQILAATPSFVPASSHREYIAACFDDARFDDLGYVSSRDQNARVHPGRLADVAAEITRLAARHPKHEVLIAGFGHTASVARALARQLPCWVKAELVSPR